MNNDRELLELAARAINLKRQPLFLSDEPFYRNPDKKGDGVMAVEWEPLYNDGDAFRLSVKLGMKVTIDLDNLISSAYIESHPNGFAVDHEGDALAATRLAIVRAAAEKGKLK